MAPLDDHKVIASATASKAKDVWSATFIIDPSVLAGVNWDVYRVPTEHLPFGAYRMDQTRDSTGTKVVLTLYFKNYGVALPDSDVITVDLIVPVVRPNHEH